MDIIVAERQFVITTSPGTTLPVRLQLSRPVKIADQTWSCTAMLDGLDAERRDTIGVDSWQALTVAVALLRQALATLARDGATFHWVAGGESITLDDLFPHFD